MTQIQQESDLRSTYRPFTRDTGVSLGARSARVQLATGVSNIGVAIGGAILGGTGIHTGVVALRNGDTLDGGLALANGITSELSAAAGFWFAGNGANNGAQASVKALEKVLTKVLPRVVGFSAEGSAIFGGISVAAALAGQAIYKTVKQGMLDDQKDNLTQQLQDTLGDQYHIDLPNNLWANDTPKNQSHGIGPNSDHEPGTNDPYAPG